jgi:hypothetical protein
LWTESSQGILFLTASTHALSILKIWRLESSVSIGTRRPQIRQLCLQLTELLRHDILAALPRAGTRFYFFDLDTRYFPWHGCLERFVDCFTADSEMGALLRYLVREVSNKSWLSNQCLDTLAALFPLSSEADHNLQVTISQHLASRSNSAPQPGPEGTTPPEVASPCADTDVRDSSDVTVDAGCALVPITKNSLHQLGLLDPGAGQEIDQRATVHVSDPGQTLGAPVSSPHCTVDMNPVARAGFAAPCTSAQANDTVPESGSGGVGSEPGQTHAGRDASGVDERSPHVAINMRPAAPLASGITSPGEANHEVGGSVEFEQISQ